MKSWCYVGDSKSSPLEMCAMATAPHPPDGGESFRILYDQEEDGRWLAEVPELPGVMTYGKTRSEAEISVTALALRVLADRTEQAKKPPKSIHFL